MRQAASWYEWISQESTGYCNRKRPVAGADYTMQLQEAFRGVWGEVRWQLVGHGRDINGTTGGRNNNTLAGMAPALLAAHLNTLATAAGRGPAYISMVGCTLANEQGAEESFAVRLTKSLSAPGEDKPVTVAARVALLAVTEAGRKVSTGQKAGKLLFRCHNGHLEISPSREDLLEELSGRIPSPDEAQRERVRQLGEKGQLAALLNDAGDFIAGMKQLQAGPSPEEWQPLLHTLREHPPEDVGHRWSLDFVHVTQPENREITFFDDDAVATFVQGYDRLLTDVSTAYDYRENRLSARPGISDAEAVHGLNAAFLLNTLLPWFAARKRTDVATGIAVPETLSTALQVHSLVKREGGYRAVTIRDEEGWEYALMEPLPGAVIRELNLKNGQLTFDSSRFYRSTKVRLGSARDTATGSVPSRSP